MTDTAEPPRCPNCGTEGPRTGKTFCEVCGDYVDWDELVRGLATAGPPAKTPTASEPAARADVKSAAPATNADNDSVPASDGSPGEVAASSAPTPNPTPDPRPKPSPTPRRHPTGGDTERARALLVPLAEPEVAPVLPDKPVPPRPEVRRSTPVQESGIVCWNCGVENRSDRRFCRNCGVDLTDVPAASTPAGRPWWRRLSRTQLILIGAAVLLALLAIPATLLAQRLFASPPAQAEAALPPPASVSAPRSLDDHPPTSAFDNKSTSWWGTTANTSASMTGVFSRPVNLSAIRITPGSPPKPQPQDQPNLPRLLDFTVISTTGATTTYRLSLRDQAVTQQFSTPTTNVAKFVLTLRSAYLSGQNDQVAISEIQFLGGRASG